MKKNLGSKLALYPMPLVVIGTLNEGKPTWTLVAHTGIIAHDRVMLSLFQKHYINHLIKENGNLSINVVNNNILIPSDYCGIQSAGVVDKSEVFDYEIVNGTPIIKDSPLVMVCKVDQILDLRGFDNVICEIISTLVEEDCLEDNKINYNLVAPILFDMPNYNYYELGSCIGKGATFGRKYSK